jgi:hypothetical protein
MNMKEHVMSRFGRSSTVDQNMKHQLPRDESLMLNSIIDIKVRLFCNLPLHNGPALLETNGSGTLYGAKLVKL